MTLYSKPLGVLASAVAGVSTLYTVPAGGGPAIIKGVGLFASAGGRIGIVVTVGGVSANVVQINNAAGAAGIVTYFPDLFVVLEPGDVVLASIIGAILCTGVVSGYQFTTP